MIRINFHTQQTSKRSVVRIEWSESIETESQSVYTNISLTDGIEGDCLIDSSLPRLSHLCATKCLVQQPDNPPKIACLVQEKKGEQKEQKKKKKKKKEPNQSKQIYFSFECKINCGAN